MPRLLLASTPEAPSAGLRALGGWLLGLDPDLADRVRLAAGEALGNAVEHGPGDPILLEWKPAAPGGILRVGGGGKLTSESIVDASLPSPDATDGRGLFIVKTVADRVTVGSDGVLVMAFQA